MCEYKLSQYPLFFTAPTPSERRLFEHDFKKVKKKFVAYLETISCLEDVNQNVIFDFDFGLSVGEMALLLVFDIVPRQKKRKKG